MRPKRMENENEHDWAMRQIDHNLKQVNKNLDGTIWMFKWLIIPMWLIILIIRLVRFITR